MNRLGRRTALALFVLTTFFYPLLAPPPHRIDAAHFQLIQPGMTEADVEAILGVPAGGYDWVVQDDDMRIEVLVPIDGGIFTVAPTDQLAFSGTTMFISSRHGPNPTFKTWHSRHGVFYVGFNEQGRVAATGSGWGSDRLRPFWRVWWEKMTGK
jgi:hypothetical protein